MLFLRKRIDGNLLLQLAPYSSQLDQVVDPFARQALRRAIMVLKGSQPTVGGDLSSKASETLSNRSSLNDQLSQEEESTVSTDDAAPVLEHNYKISSFTQEVACALCGLPLLALDTVPSCPNTPLLLDELDLKDRGDVQETLSYAHLPRRLPPYKSDYFTIPLEDQVSDVLCCVA
ncbi:unnamed protein product [Echinostoma caproni]|uniref:E3 ubiquitin-protein ligase E3D n=1 Tax=Echinostoma caproni TaxID=27848 RepID=A0A183B630_9TREM|nr:unnamed protein product [Echinostoma caproni]